MTRIQTLQEVSLHPPTGSVRVTQGFGLVAALWGVVAVVFLGISYIPALWAPNRGPIVSCFTAFAAGEDVGPVGTKTGGVGGRIWSKEDQSRGRGGLGWKRI